MQQMYLWVRKYFRKSCLFFIFFVALVLTSNKGHTHTHTRKQAKDAKKAIADKVPSFRWFFHVCFDLRPIVPLGNLPCQLPAHVFKALRGCLPKILKPILDYITDFLETFHVIYTFVG